MKKIVSSTFVKYPCFVPMINSHFDEFRADIITDFPETIIPTASEMDLQDGVMWRVNLRPFKNIITYDDGEIIEHRFERGFITDLGSVPPVFQSVIRSDDADAVTGFLNHDLDYQTKHFGANKKGFQKANQLLYDTCLFYKLPHIKAVLVKQAVDSWVGLNIYKRRLARDKNAAGFVVVRRAEDVV